MYKSLVFGDEFLAQGLHLQSKYAHLKVKESEEKRENSIIFS